MDKNPTKLWRGHAPASAERDVPGLIPGRTENKKNRLLKKPVTLRDSSCRILIKTWSIHPFTLLFTSRLICCMPQVDPFQLKYIWPENGREEVIPFCPGWYQRIFDLGLPRLFHIENIFWFSLNLVKDKWLTHTNRKVWLIRIPESQAAPPCSITGKIPEFKGCFITAHSPVLHLW